MTDRQNGKSNMNKKERERDRQRGVGGKRGRKAGKSLREEIWTEKKMERKETRGRDEKIRQVRVDILHV